MSRRRQELLKIAADLFAEHGFANVTVDHIGDAAGVSGPALYHHFTGKEALLGEMLVGISEYLLDGGRRVVDADGDDVLERLVAFHAEFAVDDRSLITVHFRDLVHATDADRARVRTLQARYVALWADVLRQRWPGLERRTAQAAVHATFGLINSTPFSTRLPRAEMLRLLTTMAMAALSVSDPDVLCITDAVPADAGEILTLQRAAFLADAQIYGDPFMPSLTQSTHEIALQIDDPAVVVLVGRRGPRLVGSVRAHVRGDTAHIGRLMTAPDLQGEGIGHRLMAEIESRLGSHTIELETGAESDANIRFYERRGYHVVGRPTLESGLRIVTMRLERV